MLAALAIGFTPLAGAQEKASDKNREAARAEAAAGLGGKTNNQGMSAANRDTQWIGDDEKPAGTDAHPTETGLINLNTATQEQLRALPGIGSTEARAIVAARPYKNIEDVMRVKDIDERAFERLRDKITVR